MPVVIAEGTFNRISGLIVG